MSFNKSLPSEEADHQNSFEPPLGLNDLTEAEHKANLYNHIICQSDAVDFSESQIEQLNQATSIQKFRRICANFQPVSDSEQQLRLNIKDKQSIKEYCNTMEFQQLLMTQLFNTNSCDDQDSPESRVLTLHADHICSIKHIQQFQRLYNEYLKIVFFKL